MEDHPDITTAFVDDIASFMETSMAMTDKSKDDLGAHVTLMISFRRKDCHNEFQQQMISIPPGRHTVNPELPQVDEELEGMSDEALTRLACQGSTPYALRMKLVLWMKGGRRFPLQQMVVLRAPPTTGILPYTFTGTTEQELSKWMHYSRFNRDELALLGILHERFISDTPYISTAKNLALETGIPPGNTEKIWKSLLWKIRKRWKADGDVNHGMVLEKVGRDPATFESECLVFSGIR